MPRKAVKSNTGRTRYLNIILTEQQHSKIVDIAYHQNKTIKELILSAINILEK